MSYCFVIMREHDTTFITTFVRLGPGTVQAANLSLPD
jgi:hypothetical protein